MKFSRLDRASIRQLKTGQSLSEHGITAERLAPTAVHFDGYGVPKAKWPGPGMVLPVTVDIANSSRFRIEWDRVLTGQEAAESLAGKNG